MNSAILCEAGISKRELDVDCVLSSDCIRPCLVDAHAEHLGDIISALVDGKCTVELTDSCIDFSGNHVLDELEGFFGVLGVGCNCKTCETVVEISLTGSSDRNGDDCILRLVKSVLYAADCIGILEKERCCAGRTPP